MIITPHQSLPEGTLMIKTKTNKKFRKERIQVIRVLASAYSLLSEGSDGEKPAV
jgi:hypothetical protein